MPDPPGGLLGVDDAIALALAGRSNDPPRPVNALADPHHLADTDPVWAGGDALRIRGSPGGDSTHRSATLALVNMIPAVPERSTGLDVLIA